MIELTLANNKKLGTAFEQEFCEILADKGYWVHFMSPDKTGSQPFDVIAAKNGKAYAFDCKTCSTKMFGISRLEDNQILAFEKWIKCGNMMPMIAVKYKDTIRLIPYERIKAERSVVLDDIAIFWRREHG